MSDPYDTTPRKQCSGPCKKYLPLTTEYYQRRLSSNDGFNYICKVCRSEQRASGKQKKSAQAYRKTDKVKEYNRQYTQEHPELYAEASKKYRNNNPYQSKATMHNGIAKRHGSMGTLRADDIQTAYIDTDGHCGYCGITLHDDFWIDHIHPLSRGGTNLLANITVSCAHCNQSKNNRTVEEWMKTRGW